MRGRLGPGLGLSSGSSKAPALPSMPLTNMLGGWSARKTGTAGPSGSLSLNDLSGNGHPMVGTSSGALILTASDPICGGSPTISQTLASNGGTVTIAAFSAPVTGYVVAYVTQNNADVVTLGTMLRLFTSLTGANESWAYFAPTSTGVVADAHGVNTQASVVCFTIPVTSGTLNSYIGQSTPATASGTVGTIPTGQTTILTLAAGGNPGGVLAELYLYSGSDSQPTRLTKMQTLAQRCGLPAITS